MVHMWFPFHRDQNCICSNIWTCMLLAMRLTSLGTLLAIYPHLYQGINSFFCTVKVEYPSMSQSCYPLQLMALCLSGRASLAGQVLVAQRVGFPGWQGLVCLFAASLALFAIRWLKGEEISSDFRFTSLGWRTLPLVYASFKGEWTLFQLPDYNLCSWGVLSIVEWMREIRFISTLSTGFLEWLMKWGSLCAGFTQIYLAWFSWYWISS